MPNFRVVGGTSTVNKQSAVPALSVADRVRRVRAGVALMEDVAIVKRAIEKDEIEMDIALAAELRCLQCHDFVDRMERRQIDRAHDENPV